MSASNISGNFVSSRLVQGHKTSITIIIIISIQVIRVISAVNASTTNKIRLDCRSDNNNFEWVATIQTCVCPDELAIFVTSAQVFFNKSCENPIEANKSVFKEIQKACNGKTECEVSELGDWLCRVHACIDVAFTCNSTADGDNRKRRNTDKRNRNKDSNNKIKCNHSTDGNTYKPTTERGDTNTGASGENMSTTDKVNNDTDSVDMKVVIIVVVSIVAFVATVIAVTLCLLFFCCQKSPLYRRSLMVRRDRQQQHQGEYDYVDESRIQDLISSPEDSTHHRGVFCVSPQHDTTSRDYLNTTTSEYQHYERISSNESPDTTNRITPSSQPSLAVSIIPVKSELFKSASSNSGSPQPVDRCNADQTHPVNAEDAVSGIQGHLTTEDLQQGIYNVARPLSPYSGAGPATYLNALSVTGDYAHLTRLGEDHQAMENVYDG